MAGAVSTTSGLESGAGTCLQDSCEGTGLSGVLTSRPDHAAVCREGSPGALAFPGTTRGQVPWELAVTTSASRLGPEVEVELGRSRRPGLSPKGPRLCRPHRHTICCPSLVE